MLRAAAGCLVLAACASAPPAEPLPATPISSMPAPASPDAAPQACLPALPSPTVDLLDGDARTIHVCFAPDACFAIDRRTSAIAVFTPTKRPSPPQEANVAGPISIDRAEVNRIDVCAAHRCIHARAGVRGEVEHATSGDADDSSNAMILTFAGATSTDPPHFALLLDEDWRTRDLRLGTMAPCARASWAGPFALITTDDCDGGSVHGFLFDRSGRPLGGVGGNRVIDTIDAFAIADEEQAAFVAPRAYALLLIDLPDAHHQDVIDLVPIQAESSTSPQFAAAPLANGDWLVASPTGGVGVVDHSSHLMTKTWIIPRCEAAP